MYGLAHNLYSIISFALTAVFIVVAVRCVKTQSKKDLLLKIFAILTVIIHYSSLYVDYFTEGEAVMANSHLLPLYPCNIAMWCLLIVAFMKRKEGKFFKFLAEVTFYLGTIGGAIGIVFNEVYMNTPNLADWDVLSGLLSHSVMLCGCVYLLAGGYMKFRVDNLISVVIGALCLLVEGGIMIGLHAIFKQDLPNCMFLVENPFPTLPWFNPVLLGVAAVVVVFSLTALYERMFLPREERWYTRLKAYIEEKRKEKGI